jgi:hypothetical protein
LFWLSTFKLTVFAFNLVSFQVNDTAMHNTICHDSKYALDLLATKRAWTLRTYRRFFGAAAFLLVENVAHLFFVPDGFELGFLCVARLEVAVLLASAWLCCCLWMTIRDFSS